MYRVTVKDSRHTVAWGEVELYDPNDDRDVAAAARKVCAIKNREMPSPAKVRVEESKGRRWQEVREVII